MDAVFLSCRAGYFLCKLTIQHSSPRESVFVRIHCRPSRRGDVPGEVPGSAGMSSMSALRAGAFWRISAILRRGFSRQTPGHLIYFWLNTVGCHYHLYACRSISASKCNQPIASLSPIILHSGLSTFGCEEEGLFLSGLQQNTDLLMQTSAA